MEKRFAKNISWSMVLAVGLAEWFMVIGKRPYPIN